MDVHSFQQFRLGLKDAISHYLHLLYTTVLHWLAVLGRSNFRLQSLVAFVQIYLWTPLFEFKRQFYRIKTTIVHDVYTISRLSLRCIPIHLISWPNLASSRTSASNLPKTLTTVFLRNSHHHIRRGVAWVRSCPSWLGSFKNPTPQFIRSITHSIPDVELLGTNAIKNISSIDKNVRGSYSGRHFKDMAFNGMICIGLCLKDYTKDHWEAATDTGSSIFEMMADISSFSVNSVACLRDTLLNYLFNHAEAAMDAGSSILEMVADAAYFITKGLAHLENALTDYLLGRYKVAIDSILVVTSDAASSSARGLVAFTEKMLSHLSWINSAVDVIHRCFEPIFWLLTTCAAPMLALFCCLLKALAGFIDFSESLFQTLVDFGQEWIIGCLDFLIDRQLECGLCMMVGLLGFQVYTVSRRCEQASRAWQIIRKVFAAFGYFLKTPFDTIIITGLVAIYLLLVLKGLIRFSISDKLRLELIVRLNTMPGAWITHMDEEPRLGLFKSSLQLQRPPTATTFSSLPTTIRSRIYQLALTDRNGFKWDHRMKTLRSNLSPSLLRVCHDTRRSTLAIPFNMNKVLIDSSLIEKTQPSSIPKELRRHLLSQSQPCGREQLLDLLTSLRIPWSPTTPRPMTPDAHASNDNESSPSLPTKPLLPHLGSLLATSSMPWVVEIREPYTRVWAFDMHAIISHLPLVPSLVVNYTITIPPGAPRPLSKAQHLARQLGIAVQQGDRDPRFRVYVEGVDNWETIAMLAVLGRESLGGVEGEGEGESGAFLCEGKTDLIKEVTKVEFWVEEMNRV